MIGKEDDATIRSFGAWLGDFLPRIVVSFDIPRSRFVSSAIIGSVAGIDNIVSSYRWKAPWTDRRGAYIEAEDWPSTKISTGNLRAWLKQEVDAEGKNDSELLGSCLAVVEWGGGQRSKGKGADRFLRGLAAENRLRTYLRASIDALALDGPDEATRFVTEMNSMLTKIHAFIAKDGLPIYDTRVAATAGCLAEMYRVQQLQSGRLPAAIAFPSIASPGHRTVQHAKRDAPDPGVIRYHQSATTPRWISAKRRLGRALRHAVNSNPDMLAAEGSVETRMRALEAGFFMIGYDVTCLKEAMTRL